MYTMPAVYTCRVCGQRTEAVFMVEDQSKTAVELYEAFHAPRCKGRPASAPRSDARLRERITAGAS